MMDFSGLNWAGWIVLALHVATMLWVPFQYGKPRKPFDAYNVIISIILVVIVLFALGVL